MVSICQYADAIVPSEGQRSRACNLIFGIPCKLELGYGCPVTNMGLHTSMVLILWAIP